MRSFARKPLARLPRNEAGAAIVEFAFVVPVLALFICGFLDFAHWQYVRVAAAGALEDAARSAGVGGAAVNTSTFEAQVETLIKHIAPSATFAWSKKNYYEFSGVNKPEKLTDDKNGNGSYDAGDCWQDLNPNGVYDTNPGRSGVGGADDIVFYQLTVTHPPLIPLGGMIPGFSGDHVTTMSTIVKRQPYAVQTVPSIRC